MKTFSIIIPTISRASLALTLESIKQQELLPGDEVIVVGDGLQPEARKMFSDSGLPGRFTETDPTHNWGMSQRNMLMGSAKGDYLLFIDDDDVYLPGAFTAIREAIQPDAVNIFKIHHTLGLLWRDKELRCGNVSTQSVVVPNIPDKLGAWEHEYCGDFAFIKSTAAKFNKINWCEPIICKYRGEETKQMVEKLICVIQTYDRPACRELQIWLARNNVAWMYGEQMHEIAVTKNRIVKTFLATEYDYLLCIANDMVPLGTTVKILTEPGDLLYCESISAPGRLDHTGDYNLNAACWRASRKVLETVPAPWFKMGHSADGTQQTYCDCSYFCRNASDAGFDSKSVGEIGHEQRMILIPDATEPKTKWQAIFPGQWSIG